jgi:hypothetical protein
VQLRPETDVEFTPLGLTSGFHLVRPPDRAIWVSRAALLTPQLFHESLAINADGLLAQLRICQNSVSE